jgi:hypothetical protein
MIIWNKSDIRKLVFWEQTSPTLIGCHRQVFILHTSQSTSVIWPNLIRR